MLMTQPAFAWIRYAVAYVFLVSGLLKLASSELSQAFISLKLPYPLHMMFFVAAVKIICGLLILFNKWTKLAAIPLIGIMIAAVFLAKLPSLHSGLLHFAFQARLDIVMLILLSVLYARSPD
ncbi:MAG TPA: DoxX family protein [Bacillaceae bacterium]